MADSCIAMDRMPFDHRAAYGSHIDHRSNECLAGLGRKRRPEKVQLHRANLRT